MATNDNRLNQLAMEIRAAYPAYGANGADVVEKRIKEAFAASTPSEKKEDLEKLINLFQQSSTVKAPVESGFPVEEYNKLLTMLLGKEILQKNLPPSELIEQLAAAVNTVFDSVNSLVGGINAVLMSSSDTEETIRVVIRSSLDADEGIGALKKFLDRTGEFFAIALKAYKEAARVKIAEILEELNPERLDDGSAGKMKFGPLYKAQLYECYQDKFKTLQNWQRSGLLLEAFMKEFEKNCQNLYSKMEMS